MKAIIASSDLLPQLLVSESVMELNSDDHTFKISDQWCFNSIDYLYTKNPDIFNLRCYPNTTDHNRLNSSSHQTKKQNLKITSSSSNSFYSINNGEVHDDLDLVVDLEINESYDNLLDCNSSYLTDPIIVVDCPDNPTVTRSSLILRLFLSFTSMAQSFAMHATGKSIWPL